MTKGTEQNRYLSEFLNDTDLAPYRDHMIGKGLSESTARLKSSHIRQVVSVLLNSGNDMRLADVGGREFDIVSDGLEVQPRTVQTYCYSFGEFLAHMCGYDGNPAVEHRVSGRFGGADIIRRYGKDLESFRSNLLEQGLSESYVAQLAHDARVCLGCLANRFGMPALKDFDVQHFRCLNTDLPLNRVQVNQHMASFGRFLSVCSGNDAYGRFRDERTGDEFQKRIDALEFSEQFIGYVQWMRRRGLRDSTIDTRSSSLLTIFGFLEDLFGHCDSELLDEFDEEMFYIFRRSIDDRAEGTVKNYCTFLGQFLEYVTGDNPFRSAKMLWNSDQPIRTWIDLDQWHIVLREADITLRTAITFAGSLGMRVGEIAGLRLDDIKGDQVKIRGKGHGPNGKVIVKTMSPRLVEALKEYLEYRQGIIDRYGDMSKGRVFISDGRNAGYPMTSDMLIGRARKLSDRLGFRFSFHTFRRFYAVMLLELGTDFNTIRVMMRHEDLDTTLRCYIDANPKLIREAEMKLNAAIFV